MVRIVRYWIPVVLFVSLIFTVSSLPVDAPSGEVFWPFIYFKKFTHVVEYAILFLLMFRAFRGTTSFEQKKIFIWVLNLILVVAIIDECNQNFIPRGGTAHPYDVIIDLIGAFIANIFVWKLLPEMPTRLRRLAESLELS